ncbi:MAG: hypothetical protein QUU85_05550, partial [Candidatus Eisenbacteria bacterium]|nr:hypothetical protein [Candidatus Eisenbacteria bacterium]
MTSKPCPGGARSADPILLIQLKRIGDVLLCTPLARALKVDRPDRRVLFLTEEANRPILEGNTRIDRVLTVPSSMGLSAWRTVVLELRSESAVSYKQLRAH